MKKIPGFAIIICALFSLTAFTKKEKWISLFDGKTLNGWKVGDHANTFSVQNGAIVANGDVAHLFYVGPVMDHNFTNFMFKAKVMTTPGSNSGIYFHTTYQESSWQKDMKCRLIIRIPTGDALAASTL